jgi:uncharacterized protein with gpF-like domain
MVATEDGGADDIEWLATHDTRVREEHRKLDGIRIPIGDRFSNGCRFPGDPTAPDPSSVIGCRCVALYKRKDQQ